MAPSSRSRPSRARRLLRWTLWSALALVLLVALALFAGPALLDLPAVQARLEQKLSEAAQGKLAWEALEVRLLPFPHGVLRKATIHIPGVVDGTVDELEVSLRLAPLFVGRVELQEVLVVRPVLKITVPESTGSPATGPADPLAAYRRALTPIVAGLQRFAPDLTLKIREGRLDADVPGPRNVDRVQINAEAHFDRSGIVLSGSSRSDTWDNVKTRARLTYADLAAEVEVDVAGLKPQGFLDDFVPSAIARVVVPTGSGSIKLTTDGRSTAKADVMLDVPAATVVHNDARFALHGGRAEVEAVLNGAQYEVTLKALRLGEVLPLSSAHLTFDPSVQPAAALSIDVPAVDLARVRNAAATLAPDNAVVRHYLSRIHSGQVSDLRIAARADSLAGLSDAHAYTITAAVADGAMLVPYIEQEVDRIAGAVEWSDGALHVRDVGGRLGRTTVSGGSFDFRLKDDAMRIATAFDLDLAKGLEVTRSLPAVPKGSLDALRGVRGSAQGTVEVDVGPERWKVDVAVKRSDSAVELRDLPWIGSVREGRVTITPARLTIGDASGALGRATFRQAAVEIPLAGPLRIDSARGTASVALAPVIAWLRQQKGMDQKLRLLESLEGDADVRLNRLAGPLDQPEALTFDVDVSPHKLAARIADLPGPIEADGGSVNVTAKDLRFDRLGIAFLDAKGRLSGTVAGFAAPTRRVDINLADGEAGERVVGWAWKLGEVPPRLLPKTPIRFAAQRARWSEKDGIDLQASAQPADAPLVEVDLAWKDEQHLELRSAHLKDQDSDATVGLKMRGPLLDVRFQGLLLGASANRLFAKSVGARKSRTQGDFHLTLDREMRGRTYGEGTLNGEHISLFRLLGVPAWINRISLRGDGKTLYVEDATFEYAKQKVTLHGSLYRGANGPVITAEIDTPGVIVDALLPQKNDKEVVAEEPTEARGWEVPEALEIWPLPLEGKVTLRAGFLEYSGYRVEPVAGTLQVQPERIELTLTQAKLCGVAFPFRLELNPQGAIAAAQLSAKDQQIEQTAKCLSEQRLVITGKADMNADLRTRGKTSELLRNLEGSVQFRARKGKVMKFALIGNILSIKSITSVLKGKVSLGAEGFDYKKMGLRGTITKGVLNVDEAAFDSNAVGLAATGTIDLATRDTNMTVLVAPFTTWDRLVRAIPVFGYIIGGTLSSIPVKVTGDVRDPTVIPLDPRAITGELVGIFQRTLDLPKKLIDSLTPASPATPAAPANGTQP